MVSYFRQTIDASKSIEEVHEEIKSIVTSVINEVKEKDLGRLWKKELSSPSKRRYPDGANITGKNVTFAH